MLLLMNPRLGLCYRVATDVKLDGASHLHDCGKDDDSACQKHCHAKPMIEATIVDKLIDLNLSEVDECGGRHWWKLLRLTPATLRGKMLMED